MTDEFKPQERLSPSSINTYLQCPREYYRLYIAKIKPPKNIHLIKGSIVHSVLENFFRGYEKEPFVFANELKSKTIKKYEKDFVDLDLPLGELAQHLKDIDYMIDEYVSYIVRQSKMLVEIGKATNESHAFYLLRPKFREMWVEAEYDTLEYEDIEYPIRCGGFIDKIQEGWDGMLTIVDYKTSSRFGPGLKEDYKRQIALYASMYYKKTGLVPDMVSVFFLRYGQEVSIPVTQDLLDYAEAIVKNVFSKTRSIDINDYPPAGGNACKFCSHKKEE